MGDFVKLSTGEAGHVVDMNWRNTTIKTPTESMTVVPNQKIASSIITNYAQPFAECSISIPVGVSYGSDLDHVEKVAVRLQKKFFKKSREASKVLNHLSGTAISPSLVLTSMLFCG